MSKLPKVVGALSTSFSYLILATNIFAQSATGSAGKGGTSGALPSAGTTEITYFLFIAGVVLFVFGMLKLVGSYREQ
ncbi:hypothetical protein HYZ70_03870 [Candidatus Curtissbacteria bacterium]|nr:hypothetical protein [Candidatus Curtissbacteria bacterium]